MYWMMGGFGGVDWRQGWLMVLLVPVILWAGVQSQPLNILALGETSARQLGMPIGVWRNALVIAIGWLVGVSVALAGRLALSGWLSRTCCVCVASPTIESYFPPRQWPVRQRCWWRISSPLALNAAELPIGGHRHAGRAGVYLATIKSWTLNR